MTGRRVAMLAGVLAAALAVSVFVWRRQQPEADRPSPLAALDAARLTRIDLATPGQSTMTLVQADGVWRLSAPVSDAADPAAIGALLSALRDFTVGSAISDAPDRHDRYDVTTASATRLTVRASGSDVPVLDLLIGKPTAANYNSSFIRFPDADEVRIGEGLSSFLVRIEAAQFRDPALARMAGEPDRISGRWKGGEVDISRSSGAWTTARGKPVPDAQVSAVHQALSGLRATAFDDSAPLGASEGEFRVVSGTVTVRLAVGGAGKTAEGIPVRRMSVEGRAGVLLAPDADVRAAVAALKAIR